MNLQNYEQSTIYALSGFLGCCHDWQVFQELQQLNPIDIYSKHLSAPNHGLEAWAESFNRLAANDTKPKVLLGYSLGGRLALHALCQKPELWQAAIIISAHPGGIANPADRLIDDELWAKRFENDPWPDLMQAWNQRSVLATSQALIRHEHDYDRIKLADTLRHWSLGHQKALLPVINKLSMPILWMAGEKDPTYCKLLNNLPDHIQKTIIPNAGHRLPWDNPTKFQEEVLTFLDMRSQ